MPIQTKPAMTVAEYLEWEERQEIKHEYIDGDIIEMSGGTGNHSKIAMNIALALGGLVNLMRYVFHSGNMRIRISDSRYVYPDLSLVRKPERFQDESELALLNPVFAVEVTSPSSRIKDRVDKLEYYLEVPSIEAYLIIDHDRPRADLYNRAVEGWRRRVYDQPGSVIPLDALNCELPLERVYRGLEFANA